jgi:hypothetical protein
MHKLVGKFVNMASIRKNGQVWGYKLIIPAFRRLRQEDQEFRTSLGYMAGD